MTKLPADQWIHFDIECVLGKGNPHTWKIAVTIPGQAPQTLADLPCNPGFSKLEWLGFISNSTTKLAFFLDNVKLEIVKGK